MLARQIERTRRACRIDRLVVATSSASSDAVIAELCDRLAVDCFRGSLEDVLDRYYQAALNYSPDHVVRLTGDCPLTDPAIIDLVIARHLDEDNDYTSNTQPATYPDGLDVEVVRFEVLRRAWQEARLKAEREHVTYYIYTKMSGVRIGRVESPRDWSSLRWTVDEPADLEFVDQVYRILYPKNSEFGMQEVLELVVEQTTLAGINEGIERNEGLRRSLELERAVAGIRDYEQSSGFPGGAKLIQEMVSFHATRNPAAVLIHDNEGTLSYGEADSYTNRLARFLKEQGLVRGDRVAFLMEKSRRSIHALIGILKADAIYVPLDIQAPAERLRAILSDCDCRLLITDGAGLNKAFASTEKMTPPPKIVVLCVESIPSELPRLPSVVVADSLTEFDPSAIAYKNLDIDLAYIIYTSGSTGSPKGVMIRHGSVLDYVRWTVSHFAVTPTDRLSSHAGFHFDLSVFDLFTAMMAGASLHPVPRPAGLFPLKFLEFVEDRGITIWCSVPTFLSHVSKSGVIAPNRMPTLRAVTFCGEVMPTPTIISWMTAYPHIKYVNQYGPTETTCASMYYDIQDLPSDPKVPLPIGKSIPNSEVFALTEDNRLAAKGEVGELYIRGAGNSLGYWNNPQKTVSAFVQNPLAKGYTDIVYATGDLVRLRTDGTYDFVGRKDTQIKLMGYRIEPGEVELALVSLPGVASAAVVKATEKSSGEQLLIAFVVSKVLNIESILSELRKTLPQYMVPKKISILERLPENQNGKVDRLKLMNMADDLRI